MSAFAAVCNRAWRAACRPAAKRFRASLEQPGTHQRQRLLAMIRANKDCAFGREHGFATITCVDAYRDAVPIRTWDDFAPWMAQIRNGAPKVLTTDPVLRLVPTGGSSGGHKLIPWTRGLARDFTAAINPWVNDLLSRYPRLQDGPAYWSISPLTETYESEAVPIGFADDSAYLGSCLATLVRPLFAAPTVLRDIAEVDTFRYATLRCLLARPDLRLISIWHPTFFELLLDSALEHRSALLADLDQGGISSSLPPHILKQMAPWLVPAPHRAARLRSADWTDVRQLWPNLELVSCWADGSASLAAAALRRRLPGIVVQPKGLLATEAPITIPWQEQSVAVPTGSICEFIDNQGRSLWMDELEVGGEYEIVLTTGGGLWRYRLGDRVRITSFVSRTPTMTFLGRSGIVCDLVGEKLDDGFVASCLRGAIADAGFALLAPNGDGSNGYTVFTDIAIGDEECARLDGLLSANPTWKSARRLGQLAPLRTHHVGPQAADLWIRNRSSTCLGAVKPAALDRDRSWAQRFSAGA